MVTAVVRSVIYSCETDMFLLPQRKELMTIQCHSVLLSIWLWTAILKVDQL